MISITKHPYLCSFTKNSVDFELQTNMFYDTAAVAASMKMVFNSLPADGHTFTLAWTNPETFETESVSMVAMTDPTLNALGIPSNTSALGYIYQLEVKRVLTSQKLFNAWFNVELDGIDGVIITSKYPSPYLVITYSSSTSSYFTITNLNSYSIPSERTGYQMRALVYFEKEYLSNEFELVSNILCTIDSSQNTELDISGILDAEIENTWSEYPVPWKEDGAFLSKNLKRYYVKFVESWLDQTDSSTLVTDYYFAHWGGISYDDQQIGDAVNLYDGSKYLTWSLSGKKVAHDQPDWLAWMNLEFDTTFSVVMTVETNAGIYGGIIHSMTLKKFETIVFNTGYDFNDVGSFIPPGETLKHWGFEIFQADVLYTEMFRYYLDTTCERKVISYFNSFGICETFNTSGAWTESMNVSSSIAVRSQSFSLNALMPKSFVFNSTHTNSFNAITGILKNEEAKRLQQLLNATISFVLDKNRWIPSIINVSKTPLFTINQYISQIELEILKANENDRASFYELTPELEFVVDYGIEGVTLNDHGIELTTYPALKLFKENTEINTLNWNAGLGMYVPVTPITSAGIYKVKGTVTGPSGTYKIRKHIRFELQQVLLKTFQVGTIGIRMNAATSQSVDFNWGDGTNSTFIYNNTNPVVNHTYTLTGRKDIVLTKPNFKDVDGWQCFYDVGNIDFSKFPNLTSLYHTNGLTGNVYLHALSKLSVIRIYDSLVKKVNIGFQKDLSILYLRNLAFSEDALDDLFKELWAFRKLYGSGTKTITIENVGVAASPIVMDIVNGTGLYAGEGLYTDYSWSITFI